MSKRKLKRITIKIGTRVLTDKNNKIDQQIIKNLADEAAELMNRKIEVIFVSSGAIGAGLGLLEIQKKGRTLSELQAIASIGQNHLMDVYNKYLAEKGYIAGQVLLTQEDFNSRRRFLNIKYTINALLKFKAIPIINENDSVSTEEIKCGDNDRLSGLVADLTDSEMLIILTDVSGVYDNNSNVIKTVSDITKSIGKLRAFCRNKSCDESTGGMITKLDAVKSAVHSGIKCIIADGRMKNVIKDIVFGEKQIGTYFSAGERTLTARKRWIAFSVKTKGKVIIDTGAEKALLKDKKSLLPGGILEVIGKFSKGDVIEISSGDREVLARGLSNYSSEEIKKIKGEKSVVIQKQLGYKDYDEVVHRDNLVILH